MSRPRPFARALLTVLAALAALLGPASAASGQVAPAPQSAQARVLAPAFAPGSAAAAGPGAGAVRAAAPSDGRGPSCAPGAPDPGGLPAVPARAGGEHGRLPAARPAAEGAPPHGTTPVRILVRGPDRPAPGPVELSVMRV